MTQRDYILRMIEMAGKILIRLRRMILGREIEAEEVEAELQDVATKSGLDLDLLRSASHDTLVMLVSPAGEPEPGRTWIAAELFLVDGYRAEAEQDPDRARDSWERALRLYGLLGPGIVARGFPEVEERIVEVQDRLEGVEA